MIKGHFLLVFNHSLPIQSAFTFQLQFGLLFIGFHCCRLLAKPYGAIRRWILLNLSIPFYLQLNDVAAINRLLVNAKFSEARAILEKMAAHIDHDSYVENQLTIHNAKNDYSNLTIGKQSYVGKDCFFDLSDRIVIDDKAVIAMRVTILTHFDAGSSDAAKLFPRFTKPVHIESGAYVGAGSLLLPGVTIGEGAIVAAGAVVVKDVPPQMRFAGVPARQISEVMLTDRASLQSTILSH